MGIFESFFVPDIGCQVVGWVAESLRLEECFGKEFGELEMKKTE